MSFIKHSNGKIISVIETEELTEEQKKTAQILLNKEELNKTVKNNQDSGSN